MKQFSILPKIHPGDNVAIVSPSFAGPGVWPAVYELGLQRIRSVFGLCPIDFPCTAKVNASGAERSADLYAAFERNDIKLVIASIGGDDQITYIRKLNPQPFIAHPKAFFGYSDNTHFTNFLWLHGIPSYYGGSVLTEFAMQGEMDSFTVEYLKHALFDRGEVELHSSATFSDVDLEWADPANLTRRRPHSHNDGWYWHGSQDALGITWGGCLESIDELLRHNAPIPSLSDFSEIVLFTETSEEIPSHEYVRRVYRALGERGILERVRGILVGRPKASSIDQPLQDAQKVDYRARQRETITTTVEKYNSKIPIVLNMDFGHTAPQICLPVGRLARIDIRTRKVSVEF